MMANKSTNTNRSNRPRVSFQDQKNRPPITCFKCGKEGHIARECRSKNNNNYRGNNNRGRPGRFQTQRYDRNVNYVSQYDYYDSEDDFNYWDNQYKSDYEEIEAYPVGESESNQERRLSRKRVRSGEEMDENDEYIQLPEIPQQPQVTQTTQAQTNAKPKKEKKPPKFKLTRAPIEQVTEFDIANYIRELPCGISIGQVAATMPKYAAGLRKSLQRKREPIVQQQQPTKTTYAETYYSEVTATAAKGRIIANGQPVTAILDK